MAARLNRKHADSVRNCIKPRRHVEELAKCASGEREMTSEQIRAAMYLVDQSIGKAPQKIEAEIQRIWGLKL